MGIEPICTGWKPGAFASRPGPQRTATRSNAPATWWIGSESNRPQSHCKCNSPPWHMPTQTSTSSRGSSAIARSSEQMGGVEPSDSGVAHQRVTATLHLLGGLRGDLVVLDPRRRRSAFADPRVGRVGIEPTLWRIKNPLQNQRLLPTRTFVPPSGIEPEPLGLQPSAQTNYARVGSERRTRAF